MTVVLSKLAAASPVEEELFCADPQPVAASTVAVSMSSNTEVLGRFVISIILINKFTCDYCVIQHHKPSV
ncbi:hypothetical protein D3C73_1074510 [compost metagenome]